jgi:hypothetical protein
METFKNQWRYNILQGNRPISYLNTPEDRAKKEQYYRIFNSIAIFFQWLLEKRGIRAAVPMVYNWQQVTAQTKEQAEDILTRTSQMDLYVELNIFLNHGSERDGKYYLEFQK